MKSNLFSATNSSAVLALCVLASGVQGVFAQSNIANDPQTYRAAMAALKAAYEIKEQGNPRTDGFLSGPVTIKSFYRVGGYKLSFFIASNTKSMVIAFRGTDRSLPGKENEIMNGEEKELNGVPFWGMPNFGDVMVHPGWSKGCNSIFDDVIGEMKIQNAAQKNVLITGHSMGGAMAGYVTYRLMKETKLLSPEVGQPAVKADHRLVTFAAPRYAGAGHGGGYGFKAAFDYVANRKSLNSYSIEIEGDSVITAWKDKVPHIRVDRLGGELNLKTDKAEKHDADNYMASLVAARSSGMGLRIIRVFCHETSESGEDEIYVVLKPGARYPNSGTYDINEDSGDLSNRRINTAGETVGFQGDTITVELWEEDDTSADDLLGSVTVNRNEGYKGIQTAEMKGDGGHYTLYYQVESK